jgi:predicted transcriptional regulator
MDQQLQQLVEKLRVLARANEPNRVVLIEKAIDQYLNDKAGIVRLSLERASATPSTVKGLRSVQSKTGA